MKLFLHLLIFTFFVVTGNAQLRLTEISYNPPESGNDSLEYLEFYNAGDQPLHLLNYKFTHGVVYTFPDVTLAPEQYYVLSINAAAFQNVYGLSSTQWTSGALSNGGERIGVADSLNNQVIDITYSNMAPWPTQAEGTNGDGRSIEICGVNADGSMGANWKVSENNLMTMINGKTLYGTPGAQNSVGPCTAVPDFIVEVSSNQFTPKDITIDVGQTIRWENKGGTHNVNGNLATFPSNPEGFSSGSPSSANWTFDFTFEIPGVYNYQCDPHASLGMTGTVTVLEEVVVDPYPLRTIVSLKSVNADGVADSLNLKCSVRGVVYGVNMRPSGLQFTVMDDQGRGIGVFNNSNSLGYTVNQGDLIEVKGTVAQFRGLTQLTADEIQLLSSGQPLVSPKQVNAFVEEDESGLLILRSVSFVDRNQWGNGTAAGFNVDMTNGSNTFSVRIDGDVDLFTMPAPQGNLFNVTGLLSQFSPNANPPYIGGYQLQPRYMDDFVPSSSTNESVVFDLRIFPNPANDFILIQDEGIVESVEVYDFTGKLVNATENTTRISLHSLNPGFYTVMAKIDGLYKSGKLIKF